MQIPKSGTALKKVGERVLQNADMKKKDCENVSD